MTFKFGTVCVLSRILKLHVFLGAILAQLCFSNAGVSVSISVSISVSVSVRECEIVFLCCHF